MKNLTKTISLTGLPVVSRRPAVVGMRVVGLLVVGLAVLGPVRPAAAFPDVNPVHLAKKAVKATVNVAKGAVRVAGDAVMLPPRPNLAGPTSVAASPKPNLPPNMNVY